MTDLELEVQDGNITIWLPGSSYTVTYYKPKKSPQLLAKRIGGDDDPRVAMTRTLSSLQRHGGLPTTRRASSAGSFSPQPQALIRATPELATAPLIMPPRLKAYSRPCGLTQPSRRRTSDRFWLCLG